MLERKYQDNIQTLELLKKSKPLREWSCQDVAVWLEQYQDGMFSHYIPNFTAHQIDGCQLMNLTDQEKLRNIVETNHHLTTLVIAIQSLKKQVEKQQQQNGSNKCEQPLLKPGKGPVVRRTQSLAFIQIDGRMNEKSKRVYPSHVKKASEFNKGDEMDQCSPMPDQSMTNTLRTESTVNEYSTKRYRHRRTNESDGSFTFIQKLSSSWSQQRQAKENHSLAKHIWKQHACYRMWEKQLKPSQPKHSEKEHSFSLYVDLWSACGGGKKEAGGVSPVASEKNTNKKMESEIVLSGWLHKRGNLVSTKFQHRWFALTQDGHLFYFKERPFSAKDVPIGVIELRAMLQEAQYCLNTKDDDDDDDNSNTNDTDNDNDNDMEHDDNASSYTKDNIDDRKTETKFIRDGSEPQPKGDKKNSHGEAKTPNGVNHEGEEYPHQFVLRCLYRSWYLAAPTTELYVKWMTSINRIFHQISGKASPAVSLHEDKTKDLHLLSYNRYFTPSPNNSPFPLKHEHTSLEKTIPTPTSTSISTPSPIHEQEFSNQKHLQKSNQGTK
ncbi:hypothetical protein RFI_02191 [Reticulomyxa filosa]|uniref:SAM domain-containing protein n=1 Tax=Reticulomyxa filosa TaxID=46433 RepID=X6PB82_RETFI|nr:hypothetical protein RFI_02191 [Reticulomyxa filosa]|eukprot:ETO34897.1 hypothetical protein RFI_02191 [Reticulomyxa filosa]